jgi:hypothetical protein
VREAKLIRTEIETKPNGYSPRVYVTGEATWPLTWYFKDLPEYDYTSDAAARSQFKYQFLDDSAKELPGYRRKKVRLRGWWVPDFNQLTPKKFLKYVLFHQPWNDTGFTEVWLYTRLTEEPPK